MEVCVSCLLNVKLGSLELTANKMLEAVKFSGIGIEEKRSVTAFTGV